MMTYIILILALLVTERIWHWLRLWFLTSRQHRVTIDFGKEITLRPALWSYFLEIICIIFFVWSLPQLHSHGRIVAALAIVIFLLCFPLLLIVLIVRRLRSHVVIGGGKQMRFFVGTYCKTFHFDQISKYSCDSYDFYITRKDGCNLKIPATFKRSEIIMAFLERAVAHDRK